MSQQDTSFYIERQPGDLLTAEDWNQLQLDIKQDITQQIGNAVKGVTSVDQAKNAHTLDKLTVGDLTQQILNSVLTQIPKQTNYRRFFKRLLRSNITPDTNGIPVLDKISVIKHEFKACPLVDVYQLDYFRVLCSTGENPSDQNPTWVNFYLYHTTEKRLRQSGGSAQPTIFDIEPIGQQPFRILFADLLEQFKGQNGFTWDDNTTLDDLENDFWKAFFFVPNDEFEEDQYCHSPWFEKCCGEQRTVGDLKRRGDWDDIWFQMRPRKTINFPAQIESSTTAGGGAQPAPAAPATTKAPPPILTPAPTQVEIVHFDFDTLGIALLDKPIYPSGLKDLNDTSPHKSDWLNVMLLLKA